MKLQVASLFGRVLSDSEELRLLEHRLRFGELLRGPSGEPETLRELPVPSCSGVFPTSEHSGVLLAGMRGDLS